MMQIPALGGIRMLWLQWTNSHRLLSPVEKKGKGRWTNSHRLLSPVEKKGRRSGHCLKRRAPEPCLDRLFFFFLGPLH